jgi:hypothetical protein
MGLLARERGRLRARAHPADDGGITCPQGPAFNLGFWNPVPLLLAMGVGAPCIGVPLSTIALRAIRREDLTAATSRNTLARRVGGNIMGEGETEEVVKVASPVRGGKKR